MEVKPGFKQTEVGVIPEDWGAIDYVTFGQVIDGDRGGQYPGAGELQNDGHCLFLNAGNVTKNGFRFSECQFISADKDRKLNKGRLTRGDVILTTRGTVGNFAYFNDSVPYERVRINSGMVILRNTSPDVSNAYQYLVLQSDIVSSQIARLSFGSAQPQLTVKGISTLKIPIPTTKVEQDAIAGALSEADALIESLEELLAKKRNLKQGAMQELLVGKKRLPGFSGEWRVKRLGELAAFHKGKGLPKSALDPFGTVPCIHYGELFTHYHETIREINSRTTFLAGSFRSVANDVLMPTSDVTPNGLAKASCVTEDGVILGGDILVIRSDVEEILGSFLSYVIRHAEDQVLQLVTGTTVFHLYASDMKKFTFIMPLVAEQQAIVAVLDDMEAEIAALDAKLTKVRSLKQGMMQELLTGRIRLV